MLKKYLKWASAAFIAWYLIARPTEAAGVVHGGLAGLQHAANSLGTFVSSMP
jgi:hypothetical protein